MAGRDLTDDEHAAWQTVARSARRLKRTPPPPAAVAAVVPPPSPAVPPAPAPARAKAPAPAPAARAAAMPPPLRLLPQREAARLFKPHARVQARIDLHGMTQHEAHAALEQWLLACQAAGKRHVAIITGKGSRGEGVLRRAVPHWLERPLLRRHIAAIAYAPPEKGGEGVVHVLLKAS